MGTRERGPRGADHVAPDGGSALDLTYHIPPSPVGRFVWFPCPENQTNVPMGGQQRT